MFFNDTFVSYNITERSIIMDKRKEANLRVRTNLVQALISLMNDKPYEEISISEIARTAGVSRISYYRNYESKTALLLSTLDEMIATLATALNEQPSHAPVRRVMTAFFKEARNQSEIFLMLYHAGMDKELQASLDTLILDSPHFPTLDRRRTYPAYLFSGALFRLLIQWYNNEMRESPVELSNIFCQYMDALL